MPPERLTPSRVRQLGVLGQRSEHKVYQRADYLPERRAALALWGAWVEGLAADRTNVLPMPGKGKR